MSGMIGYTGAACALDRILDGLSKLEYRGYDVSGLSLLLDGQIETLQRERLASLTEKAALYPGLRQSLCGIGGTRWAPHGAKQESCGIPYTTSRLSLVHSGILENSRELRELLEGKGYTFQSHSDGEVAAKLLDSLYSGDPVKALAQAHNLVEGSCALAVLFADQPGHLYGIQKSSSLAIGLGEGESFLASDCCALLGHTQTYCALEDGEIACLSPHQVQVLDIKGHPRSKEYHRCSKDSRKAQKGDYDHFMIKEICEQASVLTHTLRPRIYQGLPSFEVDALPGDFFARYSQIHVIACGTAMHAGTLGKDFIETLARIPVTVSLASEFRFREPILPKGTLVLAISQSGETSDTLGALGVAKSQGADTLAIVNIPGSTMAREADYVLYTHAGPEISVASTKAFMVQVGVLYLVAVEFARAHGRMDDAQARSTLETLLEAIDSIGQVLDQKERIRQQAREIASAESIFYIGRGLDWPMMMEGSLKLKEVTYIHSEAYAAGEFKHGAISLVAPGMPVVALATQRKLIPQMLGNIREISARGGKVLTLCRASAAIDEQMGKRAILLPDLDDLFMPIPAAVALQLLAYYTAVAMGRDVDTPRNLTKAVTE